MGVKKLTALAVLVALSIVMSFIAFPILPHASFLKLDISDVFLVIAGFLFGPQALLVSTVVKGIFLYAISSDFIGVIANILAALCYGVTFLSAHTKCGSLIKASVLSCFVMSIVMSVLNFYVILPLYIQLYSIQLGDLSELVMLAILPFNVIKSIVISFISVFMIKKISALHMMN